MTELNKDPQPATKKGLIIAFIIVLLSINGVQLFFNYNQRQELENKDLTIKEKDTELLSTITHLDSVRNQLEISRAKIVELGGKVEDLDAIIAQLEVDKDKISKDATYAKKTLKDYKDKAEGYLELLKNSERKIEKLTEQRDALFAQKQGLELKVIAKEDSIKSLTLSKKELAQKVAMASILTAENINIHAVSPKDRIKTGPEFRAKNIHLLRVLFNFADNKIAKHESKDIVIRLIEPDGSCLFDLNTGGGTFVCENKEIFYTDKKTILFSNNNETVSFDYIKGSPFKEGTHKVEIYADGYKIGTSDFIVK